MRAHTVVTRAPAEDPATPPPAAGGTAVGSTPSTSIAAPACSARARRASTILMIVLAVIVPAEIITFTGTYFLYSRYYVVTDNAVVDADAIDVNAPASGTMTRWTVAEGQAMQEGEYLGRVALSGSSARPQVVVKAPRGGTVAINDIVGDEYVTAGQTLAIAYDLSNTWITARVEESEVNRVSVGEPVDIAIDGYPGVPMTGLVSVVQAAAAGQFSLYPSTDADPTNVQKIDQYIPIHIMPIYTGGKKLIPGMSATVHIHTSR